jgi:hypothetical protein
VKDEGLEVDDGLKVLGVELSKILPTYDVPLGLIDANEWNPNEMDDSVFNRLVEEMETTGIVDPIQIVPSEGDKFRIIGGEHRWQGAKILGWEKIPCSILTDDRFADVDLQKLLTVRLNVIKGGLNPGKFTKLYEDIAERYGAEQLQTLFGYTSTDAWNKVTKGVLDATKEAGIGGSGLLNELKKKTKNIRDVDGLGKVLNSLFKKYGSDLKHNFMVFAYGGKKHLYVMMSDETMNAMNVVLEMCREQDRDINDVLVPMLKELSSKIGEVEVGKK